MREHERKRINYQPHLEYVKELVLSEGIEESLSPEIKRLLEAPPTAVRDLAADLARQAGELVSAMEEKLRSAEDFEAYKASLDQTEPTDLTPWETGPNRADFLLYRTVKRTHDALSAVAGALAAVVEDTPEQEAQRLEQWVRDESRSEWIRKELARLEPLLVDGSPGEADLAYSAHSAELESVEYRIVLCRRDVSFRLAPAFYPGLVAMESLMPRMYNLVYASLAADIKGDPAPLLKELLDALDPLYAPLNEYKRILSLMRQGFRFLSDIRSVITRKAVQLYASYIKRPSWDVLERVARETKRYQREIFWPLFEILELLAETGSKSRALEQFARQLMRSIQIINKGVDDLVEEAERFSRFAVHHLGESLDEIEQLKQLEGFAKMLDDALSELEALPIDLSRESERRRFVKIVAESRKWGSIPGSETEPGKEQLEAEETEAGDDGS